MSDWLRTPPPSSSLVDPSELGVEVKDVVDSGPGLAFVSYPSALAKFDVVPQLFSVLFFLMLVTLGLGSATGLITGVIAVICDLKPTWNKTLITAVTCVAGFLSGLVYVTPGGQAILNLVDFFGGGFIIFALAIVEVLALAWLYGMNRFCRDIKFMMNITPGIYWKFCWGFFIPVALIAILIYFFVTYKPITYQGHQYPDSAVAAGWLLTALAMVQVPIFGGIALWKSKKRLADAFKPNSIWGPADPKTKAEWLQRNVEQVTKL